MSNSNIDTSHTEWTYVEPNISLKNVANNEANRITQNIDFLEDREWTYVEVRNSVKNQVSKMKKRLDEWFEKNYPSPSSEQLKAHINSWKS